MVNDGLGRLHSQTVDFGELNLTTSYTYDADGNVASVTDPAQSPFTSTYDGLDRLIRTQDALGYTGKLTYDGDNNVVTHVDSRGTLFTATYDNLNRLLTQSVKETLSNGGLPLTLTTHTYNDLLNQETQTDADTTHPPTLIQYDGLGRPLTVTDASGHQEVLTYDGVNLRSDTDRNLNTTTFNYDVLNRLKETDEFDASGTLQVTTTNTYRDAHNQVVQDGPRMVGGALVEGITQNDSLGRVIALSVLHPSLAASYETSQVTLLQLQYDGDGNLILSTDGDGHQTRNEYDGAERQVALIEGYGSAVQSTTSFRYDNADDLVAVKNGRPHGGPTQLFPQDPQNPAPATFDAYYTFDLDHRLVTATDGAGDTTRYAYDGNDNIVSMTDPNQNTTNYTYDELDALLTVDGTGRGCGVTRYAYDANRNKVAMQDASGNLTTYRYDVLNRLTDVFQHFVAGKIGPTDQPGVPNAARGSDPGGNVATALHWQYVYDNNGNATRVTDPKGQVTTMVYDFRDRLTAQTFSGGDLSLDFQPLSFTFAYDNNDNLTSVQESKLVHGAAVNEQYAYTFDALDRLTRTDYTDGTVVKGITYAYDRAGNRTAVVDPDKIRTGYTYDARNRLQTVTTESATTTNDYWPDSLLRSMVVSPTGSATEGTIADSSFADSYDAAGRLTHVINHTGTVGVAPTPDQLISSYQYAYDASGNRLAQTEVHHDLNGGQPQVTTYGYDLLNRLTQVSYANGGSMTYTYLANGDRHTEIGTDPRSLQPVNRTYTYNHVNELVGITDNLNPSGSMAYGYDGDGNRTSLSAGGVVTLYFYDVFDQLVKTVDGTGAAVTFDYDYNGMRVRKIDSTGETNYLYDGGSGSPLIEYDVTGATTARYAYGNGTLSRTQVQNGTPAEQFYFVDVLGSTSETTDASGIIQTSYAYDAWGHVLQTAGTSANPVQFTGAYADSATGLVYLGSRYYDPDTGSFITQDTFAGWDGEPVSLNLYLYVSANPLRYTDPTGHDEIPKASLSGPSNVTTGSRARRSTDVPCDSPGSVMNTRGTCTDATGAGGATTAPSPAPKAQAVDEVVKEVPKPGKTGVAKESKGETVSNIGPAKPIPDSSPPPTEEERETARWFKDQLGVDVNNPFWRDDPRITAALAAAAKEDRKKAAVYYGIDEVKDCKRGDANCTLTPPENQNSLPVFGSFGTQTQENYRNQQLVSGIQSDVNNSAASSFGYQVSGIFTDDPDLRNGFAGIGRLAGTLGPLAVGAVVAGRQRAPRTSAQLAGARESRQGHVAEVGGAQVRGFSNAQEVVERANNLRNRLIKAGVTDAEVGIRGSSVTNVSTKTGGEFRWESGGRGEAKLSDVDFYFTSPTLERQRRSDFKANSNALHPDVLSRTNPNVQEALDQFAFETTQQLGRDSNVRLVQQGSIQNSPVGSVVQIPAPKETGDEVGVGSDGLPVGILNGFGSYVTSVQATWSDLAHILASLQIAVRFEDLSGSELGEAQIDAVSPGGLPTVGTIVLSSNAAGVGWFVDSTPQETSEFGTQLGPDAFRATGDSPAAGKYDLLTVLLHEEGHLLGFNSEVPGFAAHIGTVAGSQMFIGPDFSALLTPAPDDDHLDGNAFPNDLMNATLSLGVRRLPSPLDVQILDTVRGDASAFGASGMLPGITANGTLDAVGAVFDLWSSGGPDGIHNGDFAVTDKTSPAFAWTARGNVAVGTSGATLTENPNVFSGLTQTFTVPDGATALRFTVSGNFNPNGQGPPDAFEAALLNPTSGASLVGAATGLTQTDAFFNLQTSGKAFFGPQTTVIGLSASGKKGRRRGSAGCYREPARVDHRHPGRAAPRPARL
jgi:RHS repeat-associated protein